MLGLSLSNKTQFENVSVTELGVFSSCIISNILTRK